MHYHLKLSSQHISQVLTGLAVAYKDKPVWPQVNALIDNICEQTIQEHKLNDELQKLEIALSA